MEKKYTNKADILALIQAADTRVQGPDRGPMGKRQVRNQIERRKGHRHQSARQRAALGMSPHVYKEETMEKIKAHWARIQGPQGVLTRDVGPSDLEKNYSHGKNTGYRTF